MKPHLRYLAFLFLFMLLTTAAFAQSATQAIDSAAVDKIMENAIKAWNVPGASLAIVRGDEVVYLKGYGVKDLQTKAPVTPDSLFAIGSTTKAFVTTALALLVDEGKMNWDDPVRKHIPWFRLSDPAANELVTMRDIVAHRTGLSRNDLLWYASPWGREEIIRKVAHVPLNRPFRALYQYQNIMFLTAGHAVGLISNSSWEEFTQKRLFDPLGMKTANFSVSVAEKASDHATPHNKNKAGAVETIPFRNIDNVGPAGSLNAGARDMAQWVRLHLNGGLFAGKRLVSAASLAETHTPQMVIRLEGLTKESNPETNLMSYGLAWTIQDYRGQLMVAHGGAIDGFRARVALLPQAKLGLVILSNAGGTQMPESASHNLTDLLLGLPKRDWDGLLTSLAKKGEEQAKARLAEREAKRFKDTKPARDLAAYTGKYEDAAYGEATVSLENGALALQWSNFKVKLEHFHFDMFVCKAERLEGEFERDVVRFTLSADGEVAELNLLGVAFKKLTSSPTKFPERNSSGGFLR